MEDTGTARNNNFGALRLLLAFAVIFSHAPEMIYGNFSREPLVSLGANITLGTLAVHGFFIISGYLIASSYLSNPSLLDFLKSRILRIYPAFVAAGVICILIVAPRAGGVLQSLDMRDWLTAIAKFFLLLPPEVPGSFETLHRPALDGPMWTIRYEFRCYLLIALLGFSGLLNRRRLVLIFTAVMYALAIGMKLYHPVVPPGLTRKLMFGVIGDPSLIFMLAAIFMSGACFRLYREQIAFTPTALALAAAAWVTLLLTSPMIEVFTGLLGTYLLLWVATKFRSPLLRDINNKYDYSYGVYLYAWPIASLILLACQNRFDISPLALGLLTSALSVIAGAASWYAIEKPILNLKHRRILPAAPQAA
jgi:peptidoglycan/LPS O-acetylase OafA/YrhL